MEVEIHTTLSQPALWNHPPSSHPALRNNPVNDRQVIQQNFENPKTQEDLISHHKQIVGFKPINRKYAIFVAKALGMENPDSITDSKYFYCPTFYEFRVNLAYNFLFKIFGIQRHEMRISEVKMCNHLSSMILWVT